MTRYSIEKALLSFGLMKIPFIIFANRNNVITEKLIIKPASEYTSSEIKWIWKNYIARGKLHLLAAPPGSAKTLLAIAIAALLSNNWVFPDGWRLNREGCIVIWSDEDSIEDVLKPRLIAANANLDNIFFIDSMSFNNDESHPIDPTVDLRHLSECFPEREIDLIIFDPITSLIKGDSNKQMDVRNSLRWVTELAEEKSCAVLGITHFTKGTAGSSPVERITGSVAFSALSRIALTILASPNSDRKVFCIAKSNLGMDRGGFEFTVEEVSITENISAPKIKWIKEHDQSAYQISNDLNRREDQRINHGAIDTLNSILEQGPQEINLVKRAMKDHGFSEKQTRTAREHLKVTGFNDGPQYLWSLPNTNKTTQSI